MTVQSLGKVRTCLENLSSVHRPLGRGPHVAWVYLTACVHRLWQLGLGSGVEGCSTVLRSSLLTDKLDFFLLKSYSQKHFAREGFHG